MGSYFDHIDLFKKSVEIENELDEIKFIFEKAQSAFMVDFRYEHCWMNGGESSENTLGSEIKRLNKDKDTEKSFKKIRNELAKKLHPDKNPEIDNFDEFKEMQEAFEAGDRTKLIDTALRHGIDIELEESEASKVEGEINVKRKKIKNMLNSMEWDWYVGDRKNATRKRNWDAMRIERPKFQKWLSEQGVTLATLEAEAVFRKKSQSSIEELLKSRKARYGKPKESKDPPRGQRLLCDNLN